MTDNPHRLPRTILPGRYDLTLEPDLGSASFSGEVAIEVDVAESSDTVVLNAIELELDEAWVESEGKRIDATVSLDDTTERATLTLASSLATGAATVHIRFRGILNDKLVGFYRSTFTDEDGNEQVLASTQMESTDARRAFPCWDEPDFKAVFALTLVVDDGLLAISNGAEIGREPTDDGRVRVHFADTIAMSTYLVAFVVGPLEATEAVDVDGIPLRVVHPLGKGQLTAYAAEVGAFCLRYYSDWFGLPYPGDKLDLVAIPDFAFGAMENLGCITFRERLLLIDPEAATQAEKQRVVDVIAHEIAHMWFGDLVTMKWWNGIWLNEAFATFMEMKATDAFRPDWQRWVDFGLSRSAAFDTDALAATRPIEFPVLSPDEAEGMFDILTYEKGASVVRMLEQYLGEERFRDGLRRYMRTHRFGNTETSDLWDALEAETGEPVRRIAESWIFQGGFPNITVERSGDRAVRLTQERFGYAGSTAADAQWAVPAILGHRSGDTTEEKRALLEDASTEVALSDSWPWIYANFGAHGFYRVSYRGDLLDEVLGALSDLPALERYVLVDDAAAALLAETIDATTLLSMAERFGDETDLSVWERVVGVLATLDRLVDEPSRPALAERVRTLLGPARSRLGDGVVDGEDDRTRTLRGVLLSSAATLGDDNDALERCRSLLEAYLADSSSVDASLSAPALSVSATFGDAALHERLADHFRRADNPQDRERLQYSLARFRDPACLAKTLELTRSNDVRTQDAPYLLGEATRNRDNGTQAWRFIAEHWDEENERFPSNAIARMVGGVRTLQDRKVADEVEQFLTDHPVPQGSKQITQHIERMWVNVALVERERPRFTP